LATKCSVEGKTLRCASHGEFIWAKIDYVAKYEKRVEKTIGLAVLKRM
jgi:hypothetical protein